MKKSKINLSFGSGARLLVLYFFYIILTLIIFSLKTKEFEFYWFLYIKKIAKNLTESEINSILSDISWMFIVSMAIGLIDVIFSHVNHRNNLKNTFKGNFFEFKKDFLKILFSFFSTVFFSIILLLGYIRDLTTPPDPFVLDFFYLSVLVFLSGIAFAHLFRYLPIFFYSLQRKN